MSDDRQPGGDGAESAAPPTVIAGRYELGEVLGRGGMSTVYRARDLVLGRQVAVKVLGSQSSDPALVRREKSEVALLASLSHHTLVTLYDAEVARIDGEERTYLVMEIVDGPTLAARLGEGPILRPDLDRMVVDLAEALHVVHTAGIVHRDIKPGNILLAPSLIPGREFSAKLADFGIASLVDSTRMTVTGAVIGTAAYLSPEQALGERVGTASDIYSLGLVLLEAATGVREFQGPMIESLMARLNRDPDVPGSLGYGYKSLLTAMTARDPAERPTAREVLERAVALTGEAPAAGGDDDATVALPGAGAAAGAAAAGAAAAAGGAAGAAAADAPTVAFPATAAQDQPTRVLPASAGAAASDAPTRALPPQASVSPRAAEAPDRRRGRRTAWILVIAALVLAAIVLVAFALTDGFNLGGSSPAPTSPATSTTPVPRTTQQPAPAATTPNAPSTPSPSESPDDSPSTPAVTAPPVVTPPAEVTQPAAPTAPGNSGKGNGNGNGPDKGNGPSKTKGPGKAK